MDNGSRYVGWDVHRDTISVAVCDSRGKLLLERVIPTSAAAVLELLELLRGKLHVAFEEGTSGPVEERSQLRRPLSEIASSLSVG